MKTNFLGSTGIAVSNLCFGSLTLSPLQSNLSLKQSSNLIRAALDGGINFIDTAEYYQNYHQIAEGIKGRKHEIVICSKSYAYKADMARASVEKALRELKRDYIDIFCLHEQESALTLQGHREALVEMEKLKQEGKIRAIGMSTHFIAGVLAAINNSYIEVVQTITNYSGLGIVDGDMQGMEKAIKALKHAKKGVYGMKPLGGGNLHHDVIKAFDYVNQLTDLDSVALGMQNISELQAAVDFWNKNRINANLLDKLSKQSRSLHISSWCTGCGNCIDKCSQNALAIKDGQTKVNAEKCILCGYCAGVCPEFCIKVY